jgi:hypothetical protein
MYLWNSLFDEKVEANSELDMRGVDGRIHIALTGKFDVGIQKISQRREVRGKRMRRIEKDIYFFEIPYSVDDPEELKERISRSWKKEAKESYRKVFQFVTQYLKRLPNGFVVFRKEYAYKVYELMKNYRKDFKVEEVLEALEK